MSGDPPRAAPQSGGLTPLSQGPIPLTVPAAWAWAAVILVGTLLIGNGLPLVADRVARVTVPPDALVFGTAAVTPAPGWTVADQDALSVTLDHQGVFAKFTSGPAQGESAAVRALSLARELRSEYRQLTVTSELNAFDTDQGAAGQLVALAGTSQTAIAASVVSAGEAVDVESLGLSTQFGESINDIEAMLRSIRIVQSGNG